MNSLNRIREHFPAAGPVVLSMLAGSLATSSPAAGIYRNGIGARAMSLGGADTTLGGSPLAALTANPAALGDFTSLSLELGLTAVFPAGEFNNVANTSASLRDSAAGFPDFSVVLPIADRFSVGLSVSPDALLAGEWNYVDAPGGLSGATSYGLMTHRSQIIVLRSALGAGIKLGDKFSLGASVGLLYNQNQLETAYVFQSHPVLRGFKTRVDLDTGGFGVDGEIGFQYRATDELQFALTYKTSSTVKAGGDITGNAAAELTALGGAFAGVQPDFAYDAEVENTFPQIISLGAAWHACPEWRFVAQVEWLNWSTAFDALPLRLRNGNNADLNAFLGSNAIDDTIPMNWDDQFVYRIGAEFTPGEHWAFRAGYSFGESPVPSGALTPLNAAIFEHTVGVGVGYRWSRYTVDLAWQWDLPARQNVGTSDLAAGEYSSSSVAVEAHWVGLTAGMQF